MEHHWEDRPAPDYRDAAVEHTHGLDPTQRRHFSSLAESLYSNTLRAVGSGIHYNFPAREIVNPSLQGGWTVTSLEVRHYKPDRMRSPDPDEQHALFLLLRGRAGTTLIALRCTLAIRIASTKPEAVGLRDWTEYSCHIKFWEQEKGQKDPGRKHGRITLWKDKLGNWEPREERYGQFMLQKLEDLDTLLNAQFPKEESGSELNSAQIASSDGLLPILPVDAARGDEYYGLSA